MGDKSMQQNMGLGKYVEQTTLLDPHNYVPGWEGGDEEKKEVSVALSGVRKNYDVVHKLVVQKEKELQQLKKKKKRIDEENLLVEGESIAVTERLEDLYVASQTIKKKHEVAQMDQRIYYHMLDRMKKDLIAMKIKTNELQKSQKKKEHIVQKEEVKCQKAYELQKQALFKLKSLLQNVDQEQNKIQERIKSLQKSIKNKEEAVQSRMKRVQNQQEIADAAANENKDSDEIRMRENFMVQKLWSVFLKRKMENEMRKSAEVDEAFQTIRAATGMTDIHSIVQKFLTREQTYSQLLVNVADGERKIDNLKKENEELMNQLHELMIDKDGVTVEGKKQFPEIDELTTEISELNKEVEECKDRSQQIEIVQDQVYGWAQRVLLKMVEQFKEDTINITDLDDKKKLKKANKIREMFDKITKVTCEQLEDLIKQDISDEDRYITLKDFLNDFASKDFQTKNIRVRPMSARSNAEDSQRQDHMPSGPSRNMGKSTDGAKDDQNEAKAMMYEIEQQRKAIKDRQKEILRKREIEKEKNKKK